MQIPAKKDTIKPIPGADSAAYDASANPWYIVTGGKDVDMKTAEIEAINPDKGKTLPHVQFNDNHVEPWLWKSKVTVSSIIWRRLTS